MFIEENKNMQQRFVNPFYFKTLLSELHFIEIKAEILSGIVHAFIYSLSSLTVTVIIVMHIFNPVLGCLGSE